MRPVSERVDEILADDALEGEDGPSRCERIEDLVDEIGWGVVLDHIDLFSRYNPGWMLAHEESGELAATVIGETCKRHEIEPGTLELHADRGPVPKGKTMRQLLRDLEIAASFSRPRVSNDNPHSEFQFHTLNARPDFPDRFDSFDHARDFCRSFFAWYNDEHRHSGIAYLTPADVFFGRATEVLAQRPLVMDEAFAKNPERFVARAPKVPTLPEAVWINPPENRAEIELGVH